MSFEKEIIIKRIKMQKKKNGELFLSNVTNTHLSEIVQQEVSMLQGECKQNCHCQRCTENGFTKSLIIDDEESFIFGGPVMISLPVSNHYSMLGHVSINYKTFHTRVLKDILKLKCTYLQAPPGLQRVILTLKPEQAKEDFTVNAVDAPNWFIHAVRAKLYSTNKLGIPYKKFQGKISGKLCVNSFMGWKYRGVEITDRLRMEDQDQIRRIKEVWTRFELIDIEGLCLVIKFWHLLIKWEIGIPLGQLSEWLSAFLSLVKD